MFLKYKKSILAIFMVFCLTIGLMPARSVGSSFSKEYFSKEDFSIDTQRIMNYEAPENHFYKFEYRCRENGDRPYLYNHVIRSFIGDNLYGNIDEIRMDNLNANELIERFDKLDNDYAIFYIKNLDLCGLIIKWKEESTDHKHYQAVFPAGVNGEGRGGRLFRRIYNWSNISDDSKYNPHNPGYLLMDPLHLRFKGGRVYPDKSKDFMFYKKDDSIGDEHEHKEVKKIRAFLNGDRVKIEDYDNNEVFAIPVKMSGKNLLEEKMKNMNPDELKNEMRALHKRLMSCQSKLSYELNNEKPCQSSDEL